MSDRQKLTLPEITPVSHPTGLHLVSIYEASHVLNRSVRTIRYWQALGKMPKRVRVGRKLLYVKDQLNPAGIRK